MIDLLNYLLINIAQEYCYKCMDSTVPVNVITILSYCSSILLNPKMPIWRIFGKIGKLIIVSTSVPQGITDLSNLTKPLANTRLGEHNRQTAANKPAANFRGGGGSSNGANSAAGGGGGGPGAGAGANAYNPRMDADRREHDDRDRRDYGEVDR